MGFLKKIFGTHSDHELKRLYPIADKIEAMSDEYAALTDEQLRAKTDEFKQRYADGESLDDLLPEAFATAREAAWRVLGMKPFRVQLIGGIVLGALLAVGGLWLLLGSGTLASPGLQRVLAVLAIAAGAAFARQMLAPGDVETASGAVVCASMPIVLLAFWLIVSYKVNIINPTVSAYAVEILALCAALIASYEFAGFAYGRPKAIKSIFWSQFAAFLCITALPDDRAGGQQLMLAAIAGILLFQSYLTASNIRPAVSGPVGGAQ